MSKKTIITIIVIAVVVGGYYWFTSNDSFVGENTENTEEEVEQSEQDRIVLGFLDKYDINTEIPSNLKYTFQLEDGFVIAGKPIIFTGTLDDVFRKDGVFYLRFAPAFFDFTEPSVFYTLRGCDNRIDEIVSREHSYWGEYVVVANITGISKPVVRIGGYPLNEDEVELKLEQPSTFLAEGTCLDLEYIDDNSSQNLFN